MEEWLPLEAEGGWAGTHSTGRQQKAVGESHPGEGTAGVRETHGGLRQENLHRAAHSLPIFTSSSILMVLIRSSLLVQYCASSSGMSGNTTHSHVTKTQRMFRNRTRWCWCFCASVHSEEHSRTNTLATSAFTYSNFMIYSCLFNFTWTTKWKRFVIIGHKVLGDQRTSVGSDLK